MFPSYADWAGKTKSSWKKGLNQPMNGLFPVIKHELQAASKVLFGK